MKKTLTRIFAVICLVGLPLMLVVKAFYEGIAKIFNTIKNYNIKRDAQILIDAIKTGDINSFCNKEREARQAHIRKNWR